MCVLLLDQTCCGCMLDWLWLDLLELDATSPSHTCKCWKSGMRERCSQSVVGFEVNTFTRSWNYLLGQEHDKWSSCRIYFLPGKTSICHLLSWMFGYKDQYRGLQWKIFGGILNTEWRHFWLNESIWFLYYRIELFNGLNRDSKIPLIYPLVRNCHGNHCTYAKTIGPLL